MICRYGASDMYIREDGTEITILMLQNDTFF